MKITILTLITITFSFNSIAKSTRSTCEDYYYAGGPVKLHQYRLSVDWSLISDHAQKKLENIIYSKSFKVLKEKDLPKSKTLYYIQETNSSSYVNYEILINKLENIPSKVSCLYDI